MEKIESKLYEEITENKRARRDFYEECMDCRQISFGTIDGDDIDEFYRLIDEYAESKYGRLKCCANCGNSVEGEADCFENCGNCNAGLFACRLEAKENPFLKGGRVYFDTYRQCNYVCDNWKFCEER